jgi:hypothetical protein
MVRTKRTKATKASSQGAKRDSGDNAGVITVATAGKGQKKRQSWAFAKVVGDAFFGDVVCMQLMGKMAGDRMSAREPEPACNGFSQAATWKAEPEWTGEASEETAETVSGGREPEE